jgi:hypothetical protein
MATQKKKAVKVQPQKPVTNQVSAYQAALAVFAKGGLNYSMIVLALAQKHPSLFLELAAEGSRPAPTNDEPESMLQAIRERKQQADVKVAYTNGGQQVARGNRDTLTKVLQALRSKAPIPAIKLLRERFGYGLRDAKDIVDAVRLTMWQRDQLPGDKPMFSGRTLELQHQHVVHALLMIAEEDHPAR